MSSERIQCYTEGEISLVNVTYENYLGLLVGGDLSVMGRVGVCQDGVYAYGSVCDANWDQEDANVICNITFASGFGKQQQIYHDIIIIPPTGNLKT